MRRLFPLLALVFLASSAPALGDGCPPSQCGMTSSATPGARLLFVRTYGYAGPLVAYDVVTGARRFGLPRGVLSADGRVFVSATWRRNQTTLTRYSARTGRPLSRIVVRGRYFAAAVSRNGDRVVTGQPSGPKAPSRFQIRDAGWSVIGRVALRGLYEVEALSKDGRRLYLVHWKRNGYDLHTYDLAARRLRATPTRSSEDGSLEQMQGTAWTSVATRDGRWLLTLYAKTNGGGFVHAFDLQRGVGYCVDVPARGETMAAFGAVALALSPDERSLYLANPILGRVFVMDVQRPRLVRTIAFKRRLSLNGFAIGTGPNGAVAPDGRTVYFSGNRSVWAYDVARARVRGPYRAPDWVGGLAVTPDGRRVVAFSRQGKSSTLDARTGKLLGRA